jgi:fructose-1-phosphate kinase PfkB-like protein
MNSTGTRLNTAQFEPLAANPTALVDAVDTVLMNGTMPAAAKTQIVTAVNAVPATNATGRAQMAVYLTASSFYYQVQH